MLIIGHRGAAGNVAENTLGSLRYAIDCQVDGVEFDVRAHGGRLIILHDRTLDRTTDGSGDHRKLDLPALRRLRATNGEPVPYLEEALAVVRHCGLINLEVKDAGIAADVIAATERCFGAIRHWRQRILLSSFNTETTAELAALADGHKLGVLFEDDFAAALARALDLRAWSIHLALEMLDAGAIRAAHAHGLKVLVYTVNDVAALQRCRELGVDGVFTDYPDRARATLRGRKAER